MPTPFKTTHNFFYLYISATFTMFCLYGMQSIQPLLLEIFQLSKFQAALLTSAVMLPLGFAPFIFGYIFHGQSVKKILRFAILYLGFFEILFGLSQNYELLLAIRFLQGLAIPAVLTSISSYISQHTHEDHIQTNIAYYIGATIIGGYFGRLLAGICTELFGWRVFFILLGFVLIYLFIALDKLQDTTIQEDKKSIDLLLKLLANRHYLLIFLSVFFVFFIFSAILNFLPFELLLSNPNISPKEIGFIYTGYIMGLLVSLYSNQIRQFFKNEKSILLGALLIYFVGVLGLLEDGYTARLLVMFLVCLGMFLFHTTSSGYINKLAKQNKSIVNGVYISFYYLGGALGSIAPSLLYETYGWEFLILTLAIMVAVVLICLWFLFDLTLL